MGRRPGLKMVRGAWTAMEDEILTNYISIHGEGNWRSLSIDAGLRRCGKSCRLRWMNYLKPGIKRGNITPDEEDMIIRLHKLLGNRWSLIAGRIPGRTDNEIKNYWNANIKKKLQDSNPTREHHFQDQNKLKTLLPSIRSNDDHPKLLSPSSVVRPKATRCTKVIISKEHQNIEQSRRSANNTQKKAFNVIEDNMCSIGMIDMDPQIFSHISEIDEFLPFFDIGPLHYDEQQHGGELIVSPILNDNMFFHEDMQGELDMDWITSFYMSNLNQGTSY